MNILIATDKFKHSLSSLEACEAIKKGLLKASSDFKIKILPMADGGDGLSEVIEYYISARRHSALISDPLFRPIQSGFLLSEDGKTAFIEMAKASGLLLLKPEEYNCMNTTTLGTGELIKEAIGLKVQRIILGLGGSATNDCGIGMAAALGYRFLDKEGSELKPIGRNLLKVKKIDTSQVMDYKKIQFDIACDVTNPLTGNKGASLVYAKQKGATENDVMHLEKGMLHFSKIVKSQLGKDVSRIKGSGAAGGLGAGCIAFLNAKLISGIDLVLRLSQADVFVKETDLVLTGEGKIDEQSLNGKVISGLGHLCHKNGKPLIAFCGELALSKKQLNKANLNSALTINPPNTSLKDAYQYAEHYLTTSAYNTGLKIISGAFTNNTSPA